MRRIRDDALRGLDKKLKPFESSERANEQRLKSLREATAFLQGRRDLPSPEIEVKTVKTPKISDDERTQKLMNEITCLKIKLKQAEDKLATAEEVHAEQKLENDALDEKNKLLLRNWPSTSTGKWIENKQMWHHLEEFTKTHFELSKLEIFGR